MKHPDYLGVTDTWRRGEQAWRYRKNGKQTNLPGQPHTPEFDMAYQAAIEGRTVHKVTATIVKLKAKHPHSFEMAYERLQESTNKWKKLEDSSKRHYERIIEQFLKTPVVVGQAETWGQGPVEDFERAHMMGILDEHYADRPWEGRNLLKAVRKLILIGMDQSPAWVKYDVTAKLDWHPQSEGYLSWSAEAMDKFEARHPVGTKARTAYALAVWLGNRRSDVVLLRWDQQKRKAVFSRGERIEVEGFEFKQYKGRKRNVKKGSMFLEITGELAEALAPLPRDTETILTTNRRTPYSMNYLSTEMQRWTAEAGIEPGHTLHGLRKALGGMMDDAEVTLPEAMHQLGHSNPSHTLHYMKAASQARGSHSAMGKVIAFRKKSKAA